MKTVFVVFRIFSATVPVAGIFATQKLAEEYTESGTNSMSEWLIREIQVQGE